MKRRTGGRSRTCRQIDYARRVTPRWAFRFAGMRPRRPWVWGVAVVTSRARPEILVIVPQVQVDLAVWQSGRQYGAGYSRNHALWKTVATGVACDDPLPVFHSSSSALANLGYALKNGSSCMCLINFSRAPSGNAPQDGSAETDAMIAAIIATHPKEAANFITFCIQ